MSKLNVSSFAILVLLGADLGHAQTSVQPGDPKGPAVLSMSSGQFSPENEKITGSCPTSATELPAVSVEQASSQGLLGSAFSLQGPSLVIEPMSTTSTMVQKFTVEGSSSESAVLMSTIGVSFTVQGMLAAFGNATAAVHVDLTLSDVTAGGTLIASETLFRDQMVGKFNPNVAISAGALLPAPDGKFAAHLGASIDGGYKVVDRSVKGGFEALLQRGHTYELTLELDTKAQVGYSGGLAMTRFLNESVISTGKDSTTITCLNQPVDLTYPVTWLDAGLKDVLKIPGLSGSFFASQAARASSKNDSAHKGPVHTAVPASLSPVAAVSIDPIDTVEKDVEEVITDVGNIQSVVNGIQNTVNDISTGVSTITGFLNNSLTTVFQDAGLPAFGADMSFSTFVSWLEKEAAKLEPAFAAGGLTNASLSITVSDDLYDQAITNTAALAKDISTNTSTVKTAISDNTSTVKTAISDNTSAVKTAISDNTSAVKTAITESTTKILAAIGQHADQALTREIEDKLAAGKCELWMVIPESTETPGGQLAKVAAVVNTAIANAQKLGGLTQGDKNALNGAEKEMTNKNRVKLFQATSIEELSPEDTYGICTAFTESFNCVMAVTKASPKGCAFSS